MSRRARCELNADFEPVAADEPTRGCQKYREQRVASRRHRKQHAQRIALVEVGESSNALATSETDFGRTFRQ
jgi:hypothetical protein